MKLNFNIDYRTNWGESVYIVASIPQLGGGDEGSAVKMELDGVGLWTLSVDVPEGTPAFDYRYVMITGMCAMNGAALIVLFRDMM